jgi:hypothetical protein
MQIHRAYAYPAIALRQSFDGERFYLATGREILHYSIDSNRALACVASAVHYSKAGHIIQRSFRAWARGWVLVDGDGHVLRWNDEAPKAVERIGAIEGGYNSSTAVDTAGRTIFVGDKELLLAFDIESGREIDRITLPGVIVDVAGLRSDGSGEAVCILNTIGALLVQRVIAFAPGRGARELGQLRGGPFLKFPRLSPTGMLAGVFGAPPCGVAVWNERLQLDATIPIDWNGGVIPFSTWGDGGRLLALNTAQGVSVHRSDGSGHALIPIEAANCVLFLDGGKLVIASRSGVHFVTL